MGPDCGTAIVNGIPLGFANVVRRGPIGVVGASGTGTQEVTARIHELGSGVSQAIGTGGHDLAEAIGGISMLRGMRWLEDDPDTKVVVLVSKPPHPTVAAAVLAQAAGMATPVVSIFLGADPDDAAGRHRRRRQPRGGRRPRRRAAPRAARPSAPGSTVRDERARAARRDRAAAPRRSSASSAGSSRAGRSASRRSSSSARRASTRGPTRRCKGNATLDDIATSVEHTIIDMGDDEFTQGRPHPMIDPGLRDERLAQEAADPTTAVLLVDVVLGYGSTMDPVSGLVDVLARSASPRRSSTSAARPPTRRTAPASSRSCARAARSSPRRTPRRPRGPRTSRPSSPRGAVA